MSTVWLNDLSSANLLRKTYISGFLDISGGDMNLRSGNFFTGGTITQNTDSANVDVPSYSMFSVTDLSYMFASITAPMTTFSQDITTNGNTVVKQNLFVTNDASLNSRLFLGGDASLNSRLFLGGDASLNSKLFLRGDASMNSRLFLGGDASLNSRLFLGGDASLNSKLSVAGDVSLNSKLMVAGDVSLNSKLMVAGDVSLNSKLSVTGDVSMNGNVGFSPSTSIYGGSISGITNDLHVYGLNVGAGDASLNSKLSVAGDVSMNSKLSVVGDVSMNSNLYILGKTSAIGAVDICGNVAIGKTSAGVALDVSGDAKVFGNVSIGTNINSSKLTLRSDTLSSVLSSTSNLMSLVNSVGDNSSYLNIYNYRYSSGNTWLQSSTRIQNVIDVTNQSYIEFNAPGSNGGIGLYAANTAGLTDTSGGITINRNGNVSIGKTTANATLDVSGRFIVNGSISYSNYYFKFTCSNSMVFTAGASIGFTNSTGTPYYNSGYTQDRYFLAPVTGYYHLSYTYNIVSNAASKYYIGYIISATDPTGFSFVSATWSNNSNILAINAVENASYILLNGNLITDVYLTSGQRVYVIVAFSNGTVFNTYSWGNPATNIWTGYLISQ